MPSPRTAIATAAERKRSQSVTQGAPFYPEQVRPLSGSVEIPGLQTGVPDVQDECRTILVVDGSEVNRRVLKGMLKPANYRILEADRAVAAMSILRTEKVDLIVIDLVLPEMDGLDFCRRVKNSRLTQLIPLLILTNVQGAENEIAGIESGADEFLTKPLHPTVVRARVRAMLRNKAAIDLLDEAETILFGLAQAVEQRDKYTSGHCLRLAEYSVAMGMSLNLGRKDLLALHRGGYLHDIGKISVPDAILFKNGPLTPAEWGVMRAHPISGEQICSPMKSLQPVLPIIRSHHERWDGTGYPDGLKGEEIPLLARILQAADIYDALTTARPYKPAHPHDQAIAMIEQEVRYGWRDPAIVDILKSIHPEQRDAVMDPNAPPAEAPPQFSSQLSSLNAHLG